MPLLSARCSSGSLFVPGRAQPADRPVHAAVQLVLGDQRAGLGLRHQDRRPGVLQRADAVQHRVLDHDARLQAAGQQKAADAEPGGREDLDALPVVRRVGDDEGAVGLDGKRGGIDDLARLAADLDDLPRARLLRVEAVDRVGAAVEDEVLAGGGLLKAGRLAELARDVRGHRTRSIAGCLASARRQRRRERRNRRERRDRGESS